MLSQKRQRVEANEAAEGAERRRFITTTATDGDDSEEEQEVLDEFDDDSDYDEMEAANLLTQLGRTRRAGGAEDDDGREGGTEQQQLLARIVEHVEDLADKRRRAQAIGVEVRHERKQRRSRQRNSGGRFQKAPAQGSGGPEEEEEEEDERQEQEQERPTRRQWKRKRQQQSKELMRDLRARSKEERRKALEEALGVLERAFKTGKVMGLIETPEEKLKAMGLDHKISDFGRSCLAPYRHRVNALYTWHSLVLNGEKKENAYRLVGQAYLIHYNTVRQWVRGFHANNFKIGRLLSGLHSKTASYLDDADNKRKATTYVRSMMSKQRKEKAARRFADLQQQQKRYSAQLQAAAAAAASATDTQQTAPTQTAPGGKPIYCVCQHPCGQDDNEMIECHACEGWYHLKCIGIDPNSREYRALKRGDYTCAKCVQEAEEESRPERIAAEAALEALHGRDPAPKSAAAAALDNTDLHEAFSGRVFHRWINGVLLKDMIAAGAKPISLRTAYNWLHKLGFRWITKKKTVYIDGHERVDVVEHRYLFLLEMAEHQKYMVQYLGPDAMDEIIPPTLQAELDKAARGEPAKKEHVLVVHDEMVMGAFDGNKKTWQGNGVQELPRKSLGPVVMCSEYLSEKKGPMVLRGEVWENAPDELCMELRKAYQELNGSDEFAKHDDVRTRVLILPGKSREGYWEGQHVVEQWERLARPVFELLHPGCVGVFEYDNSSGHNLFAPDALVATRLNANPGGQQPPMRKGWFIRLEMVEMEVGEFEVWTKEEQSMVFEPKDRIARDFSYTYQEQGPNGKKMKVTQRYTKGEVMDPDDARLALLIGKPKGAWQVMAERGIHITGMPFKCKPISAAAAAADDGEAGPAVCVHAKPGEPNHGKCCGFIVLAQEPDFASQRPWLREVIEDAGHICIFLPKFHPEMNFIERYWAVIKRWLRYHCDEGGNTMRVRMKKAMDDPNVAPLSLIRKHARICWRYMDAYRKWLTGPLAEYAVKKAKSHRMVSDSLDQVMEQEADAMLAARLEQLNDPVLIDLAGAEEDAEG